MQIEGRALENGVARHFSAPFYRKDGSKDGRDLLFYDVADASTRSELSLQIKQFIDQNRAALEHALQHPEEVESMNLDIGIVMNGPLSKTVALDNELVAELGRFGISVSVSAYQGTITLSDDGP